MSIMGRGINIHVADFPGVGDYGGMVGEGGEDGTVAKKWWGNTYDKVVIHGLDLFRIVCIENFSYMILILLLLLRKRKKKTSF